MYFLKLTIALCCLFITNVYAAIDVEDHMRRLPSGTNLAIVVQDIPSSKLLVSHNGDALLLPASTMKVITALAASLELGNDFHFNTTFETDATLNNGILAGSLIARFSGDPMFTRKHLLAMVDELQKKGVKQIAGNLVINTSIFASHDKAQGWSWNNLTHCYNAPPSAVILNRNCFHVQLKTGQTEGALVTVSLPDYSPVKFTSFAKTTSKNNRYCELDVVVHDKNSYVLNGCVVQQKRAFSLSFAVQDATDYVGQQLKQALNNAGIKIVGNVIVQNTNTAKTTVLVTHQSPPLTNMLNIMLKQSDNLIADSLFRTLGYYQHNTSGTWLSGSDAVRNILLKKANIDLDNSIIADGSGLSKDNLISANTMMQVLHFIAKHDEQLKLVAMMPIAGVDGSLRNRKSLINAGLEGKMVAKTGTLRGVHNLAGFITTAKGQNIAFVQFLNGYSVNKNSERKAQSLASFEQSIYKKIYAID